MGEKRVDGTCDAAGGYVPALCETSRIARGDRVLSDAEGFLGVSAQMLACPTISLEPRASVGVPDHGENAGYNCAGWISRVYEALGSSRMRTGPSLGRWIEQRGTGSEQTASACSRVCFVLCALCFVQ